MKRKWNNRGGENTHTQTYTFNETLLFGLSTCDLYRNLKNIVENTNTHEYVHHFELYYYSDPQISLCPPTQKIKFWISIKL